MRVQLWPLLLLVSGCATVTIKGVSVLEESWDDAVEQVRAKAAFDLQCPATSLDLTILTTQQLLDGVVASTIGVRGCGKQATWVRQKNRNWLAESTPSAIEAQSP